MVPNGWKDGRVADLLKGLESGVSVNGEDRLLENSELGVLKVSAVSYGVFNPYAAKAIDSPEEQKRAKTNPKKGQIIISRSNTEELVGASAYINDDFSNLFLPDKLWQTVPKKNSNMKWLSYVLSSEHSRFTLSSLATGTSGSMKNITKGELLSLKIGIPPLPEQRKIAKILSTWDQAIATTERLIAASQQQKKALMQQLLTGKKRLVNPETGLIFDEWKTSALGLLSQKIGSGVTPKGGSDSYKKSGIPLIRSQNVLWGNVDLSEIAYIDNEQHKKMKASTVLKGDVLLNITGASIGRAAVSYLDEANVNQHVCIIRSHVLNSEYLKNFLLSFPGQKQIEQFQAGGNRQGLNFEQIKSFKIPVPSLSEQQKIASILAVSDKEIELLAAKLAHLKNEKKALMQQLLTGKRRVKIDATEAA